MKKYLAVLFCALIAHGALVFLKNVFFIKSESMNPTFIPGDVVYCSPLSSNHQPIIGEVVTFQDFKDGRTVLVKRIHAIVAIERNLFYDMRGDNANNSFDSRHFGLVPKNRIKGRPKIILFSWDANRKRIRKWRCFKTIQ